MKIINTHPAEKVAATMCRLYANRLTTTSGGNLSIQDGDSLWISPAGIDKSCLKKDDIMEIKGDGSVHGIHRPSTEFPFHVGIRRVRPELKAVLHAHPAALVAFSLARRLPDLDLYPGVRELCGKLAMAKFAVPGSIELGRYVTDQFVAGNDMVMLENHGVALGADSMEKAYMMFEALEFSARTEIAACALGGKIGHVTSPEKISLLPQGALPGCNPRDMRLAADELCAMSARCAKNFLFSAAFGEFAVRLPDGSFAVTPYGEDRATLTPDMIVRVKDGVAEGGIPSARAALIEKIFKANPDIPSIVIARSPEIMGFAVSDALFDSRLIPESYIFLKDVYRFAYGASWECPDDIAKRVSVKNPIAIINNDCVIVGGSSPLNAYDRLEVMEFSATSLHQLVALGEKAIMINDEQVKDIEKAFNL